MQFDFSKCQNLGSMFNIIKTKKKIDKGREKKGESHKREQKNKIRKETRNKKTKTSKMSPISDFYLCLVSLSIRTLRERETVLFNIYMYVWTVSTHYKYCCQQEMIPGTIDLGLLLHIVTSISVNYISQSAQRFYLTFLKDDLVDKTFNSS